jgi:hypothetical protein
VFRAAFFVVRAAPLTVLLVLLSGCVAGLQGHQITVMAGLVGRRAGGLTVLRDADDSFVDGNVAVARARFRS